MSKKKRYSVYKLVSPRGKVYIGITSMAAEKRWYEGRAYEFNRRLANDIALHGWDAFEHEVLFCELTEDEAKSKEVELIIKHNSTNFSCGYNIDQGGNLRKRRSHKPVKCLTTNICFSSIQEAGEFYGISKQYISKCLTGRTSFAGEINGEKLTWAYVTKN